MNTEQLESILLSLGGDGKYDECLLILEPEFKKSPEDPKLLSFMAVVMQGKGESSKALEFIEKSIEKGNGEQRVWSLYGTILHSLDRIPESKKAFNKAIQMDDSIPTDWFALARVYFQNEEYQQVLDCCDAAVKFELDISANPDYYRLRGMSFYKTGKLKEAYANIDTYATHNPEDENASAMRAKIKLELDSE